MIASSAALTTSRNRPSVKTMNGRLSRRNSGPRMRLTTEKITATVLEEEGRPPESIFDFVQGITALARGKPHQDARLELEGKAAKLLAMAG